VHKRHHKRFPADGNSAENFEAKFHVRGHICTPSVDSGEKLLANFAKLLELSAHFY